MVFCAREPDEQELESCYGDYPVHADLNPLTRSRYHDLLDRFEPYRKTGRILDVGAGSGYFLDTAMGRGWEVHGTEYDPAVVEACRQRGMNMNQGSLDPSCYPPGSFDVITSFEVLEHLVNPQDELDHFGRLLRAGGVLYLTTPNFSAATRLIAGGKWHVVNYPEHLNYYTPSTLTRALRRAGFKDFTISTTGISVMRLRNSFSTGVPQANVDPHNDDQRLRKTIEQSVLLRGLKGLTNKALTILGVGDSMKLFAVRS
jgi:SAM-dependent methyltransferase